MQRIVFKQQHNSNESDAGKISRVIHFKNFKLPSSIEEIKAEINVMSQRNNVLKIKLQL